MAIECDISLSKGKDIDLLRGLATSMIGLCLNFFVPLNIVFARGLISVGSWFPLANWRRLRAAKYEEIVFPLIYRRRVRMQPKKH